MNPVNNIARDVPEDEESVSEEQRTTTSDFPTSMA
jgi:hypothetical protein